MNRESKRMNKWIHKIVVMSLLVLCAFPFTVAAASAQTGVAANVTIKLDGKAVKLQDPVRIKDGRLYMPASRAAELFDAKKISWNGVNDEATIHTAAGNKIVLGNGVPVVYYNGTRYLMDAEPFLKSGRIYVPLRYVAELLQLTVDWNNKSQTAEFEEAQGADKAIAIPKAKAYTEKDYLLLAKITQVESGNESYEGQLGVANVILNRVKDSRFPDSVRDVIYSGKQFPPAHNGLLDKSIPNASVLRAAKDALNGKNNVEKALYFYNPQVSNGSFWDSLDIIKKIGHHAFAR
ncbi:cell wall hydrolase [Paenibacillus sp. N4]|uniref:cell wall hydrolase n=1 Tax=Paenibacillus vietnamensis TaxID=2590547 RepID=UPI001CD10B0B|nr:cell wall hydrolase [Paenibacillus vietnamensis]MCA0757286.1 cell wall hydrolase [Paenibacillus vietnamensis]